MLFGSSVALQEIGLLAHVFLGGFSFSLSSPVLLSGQAKSGSGFHTGHGWFFFFALSEGRSSSFYVWVPFFLSNLAAFCLGRLKSALRFCGRRVAPWLFLRSRSAAVRSFLGFGVRRLAVFLSLSLSLYLSLVSCCSFFFCGLVRPHFF